jgi:surface protein
VETLIVKKRVCRTWRDTCTDAIDAKRTSTTRKAFSSNQELLEVVKKYCGYTEDTFSCSLQCDPQDAEEIATTYAWPSNKWDVSNLQIFGGIFSRMDTFNEDMSFWNVSRATTMSSMFQYATAFNHDLSSWNVSNVTDMEHMLCGATALNGKVSSWDVSQVTDMMAMFEDATVFNSDLRRWNSSDYPSGYEILSFQSCTTFQTKF